MSAQKHLRDMAVLYPNFKINPSKLSGNLKIDIGTLKVDSDVDPENWKVLDSSTGNIIPVSDIKGAEKLVIAEFIATYKDVDEDEDIGEVAKETPGEPDDAPDEVIQEPLGDADKLAMLDDIMDGKVEPVRSSRVQVNRENTVQKMPAVIPIDIRSRQIQELTIQDIKDYICPNATEQEAFMFLKLCQARNLNPFLNEAYLIKYGNKTTMTVGKEAFMRRAEAHPQFDGFKAGIIIQKPDEELERREGTFILKNETLVGGWAKIYRKDRKQPFVSEVSLHEYDLKQSLWISKPATMIRKVAIVQGKREAFPSEFGGMYDQSEVDGGIIEADYMEVGV